MNHSFSRRSFTKLLAGAALATVPAARLASPTLAGRTWCRKDPIISLNGHEAAIYLLAALEDYEFNNSSCDILIKHPKDVKTKLIWVDPSGYFGQGCSVNFAIGENLRVRPDSIEVEIFCRVPASRSDLAVGLKWAPGPITWGADGQPLLNQVLASAQGTGNTWFGLRSSLPTDGVLTVQTSNDTIEASLTPTSTPTKEKARARRR